MKKYTKYLKLFIKNNILYTYIKIVYIVCRFGSGFSSDLFLVKLHQIISVFYKLTRNETKSNHFGSVFSLHRLLTKPWTPLPPIHLPNKVLLKTFKSPHPGPSSCKWNICLSQQIWKFSPSLPWNAPLQLLNICNSNENIE